MSQSLYEVLALGARYLFAALMVLIVLRAWRITLIDSRRAATLRRMSPQTGLSGELMVMEGDGKARRGMKYPVIREGMIGSSRRADIRIRHASVRRRHAWFQLTEEGLRIRTHAGAPMLDADGHPARALVLPDGGAFTLGRVTLMLILNEAPEPAARRSDRSDRSDRYDRHDRYDLPDRYDRGDLSDRPDRPGRDDRPGPYDAGDIDGAPDPDDLFDAPPAGSREARPVRTPRWPEGERRLGRPIDVDEYFDVDDGEDG